MIIYILGFLLALGVGCSAMWYGGAPLRLGGLLTLIGLSAIPVLQWVVLAFSVSVIVILGVQDLCNNVDFSKVLIKGRSRR